MARNQSTVYVGNLSEKVTEDLLYELFLQAGPVANVNIPSDRGRPKPFGFVEFKHPVSVLYAIQLFEGVSMFGKTLRLNLPKGVFMPGAPPMGPPPMPRMDHHPQQLIHPLSVQGRLGPPPMNDFGRRRRDDDDRDGSGERHRSRRRDEMLPSSRPMKNRHSSEDAPPFDLDSIPDSLDFFSPTEPSYGSYKSSHGSSSHGRRRERPYEDRGNGSNRPNYSSRRGRHSNHPSNNLRHY